MLEKTYTPDAPEAIGPYSQAVKANASSSPPARSPSCPAPVR